MSNGAVLEDDNGKPVQALYDASGHQIVAAQAGTVSTDAATGAKYAAQSVIDLINGAAASLSNPYPGADQIRMWIQNGQGFSATTGKQNVASAMTTGLSVFNPLASGKTLLVFSAKCSSSAPNLHQINITAADPALGTAATPVNSKGSGGVASIANATYANVAVTPSGTTFDIASAPTNTTIEFFVNTGVLFLPAGTGLLMLISASTNWAAAMKWIEF